MPITDSFVLVTGASGFIASHIVRELLARGYRVRGSVRSLAKEKDFLHLRAMPFAERLELFEADLLQGGAFDDAARGCSHVIHTASPYVLDAKDPQKDLIEPAVQGTRGVLASCKKAGTVRRVVLTSSMAAITDEPESDHLLTEEDWNTKSTLERNPYYLSKTLAEKEGWKFLQEERAGFDLVVVNPFLVIGPSYSPGLNTSNQLFVDLLKGTYPGIMNLTWGFVDVRDVALAHVLGMETATAQGRYICAADTISMRDVVALLDSKGWGEGRKLPKLGLDCSVGDFAVKISSYLQPKGVGSYLRTHVGRVPRFSHAKIERELGLAFRKVEQSILDTVEDLKKWGHIA
ncbi:MAG: SDR family oxidoreductase [Myxococcales bacterium]|nr:SDR family oxidoreductase [Myxococcales bacterium]